MADVQIVYRDGPGPNPLLCWEWRGTDQQFQIAADLLLCAKAEHWPLQRLPHVGEEVRLGPWPCRVVAYTADTDIYTFERLDMEPPR